MITGMTINTKAPIRRYAAQPHQAMQVMREALDQLRQTAKHCYGYNCAGMLCITHLSNFPPRSQAKYIFIIWVVLTSAFVPCPTDFKSPRRKEPHCNIVNDTESQASSIHYAWLYQHHLHVCAWNMFEPRTRPGLEMFNFSLRLAALHVSPWVTKPAGCLNTYVVFSV